MIIVTNTFLIIIIKKINYLFFIQTKFENFHKMMLNLISFKFSKINKNPQELDQFIFKMNLRFIATYDIMFNALV